MAKNRLKRNRLITFIVVAFMVFSMILFTVAGVISSFGNGSQNQQSNINTNNPNASKITQTDVLEFNPTNISSNINKESGYCLASSVSDPLNPNAFRCMVKDEIFDPCFLVQSSTNLLCNVNFNNLNGTSTFVLENTKPLPAVEMSTSTDVIGAGILLTDGTYCTPLTGTRPFSSEGYSAYYSCVSNNKGEDYIFNKIDDSAPVFKAIVGSLLKGTSTFPPPIDNLQIMSVKTVWK
jgi:hypothetical protein